jgi:hypothetical protein
MPLFLRHPPACAPTPTPLPGVRKLKTGNSEPLYEKYVLKASGIKRLN